MLIRVNNGTHAMQPTPCLQPQEPQEPNSVDMCGAYARTEHHRKKKKKRGKTALRREICCLCCTELGWGGGKGVRERLGEMVKLQHYLELANCH